jgi:hypothetical protein
VILTTIVALGLAVAIHFALPSVHPDRRRREFLDGRIPGDPGFYKNHLKTKPVSKKN